MPPWGQAAARKPERRPGRPPIGICAVIREGSVTGLGRSQRIKIAVAERNRMAVDNIEGLMPS
jgi:hypothetical protein